MFNVILPGDYIIGKDQYNWMVGKRRIVKREDQIKETVQYFHYFKSLEAALNDVKKLLIDEKNESKKLYLEQYIDALKEEDKKFLHDLSEIADQMRKAHGL